MEPIFLLPLAAGFFFAFGAFFDKFILENKMENAMSFFFLQLITAMVMFPILSFLIFGFKIPSIPTLVLILFSAVVVNVGFLIYFSIVKEYDLSSVGPLIQTKLLFAIPLGYFFLGEFYGLETLLLMLLIFAGAILTTYSKSFSLKALLFNNKLLALALIMSIAWALSDLPVKMVSNEISGPMYIAWRYILSAPVLLVFGFDFFRGSVKKSFFSNLKKTLPFSITANLIGFTGLALMFISYEISFTITSALVLSQAIFVFILAFVISKVKSSWIDERHSMKVYLVRLAGVLLIISSIYFLMSGNLVL